jgi:hypothetical protein
VASPMAKTSSHTCSAASAAGRISSPITSATYRPRHQCCHDYVLGMPQLTWIGQNRQQRSPIGTSKRALGPSKLSKLSMVLGLLGRPAMAKRPPKHVVDIALSANDMARVGAALDIRIFTQDRQRNKQLLGTIQIGQGSFRWARAHARFRRLPWQQFAEVMDQALKPGRRKH